MDSPKKIYDIEITPPAGAWDAIAQELGDLKAIKNISAKMAALEITPPPNLWNAIEACLNEADQENKIAQKLYNQQMAPPAMAWENISRELDDQRALEIIEHKLANIQLQPPVAAWENIKKGINKGKRKEALVVPMQHNHGWLKYAAAACFIAIISITAFFIFNDGSNGDKLGFASNTKNGSAATGTKNQALTTIQTRLGNAYTISNEKNTDLQNRYIILMTQDGNIVRMSKKVGNMADCIAGEDSTCDDQISKLQKEMASSATTATPGSFLDILDIAADSEANN